MKIWAIIPVKHFSRTKSRLTAVLTPAERQQLTHRLFVRLLRVLAPVDEIEQILVVTRDAVIGETAVALGHQIIAEPQLGDLNGAVQMGAGVAREAGATHVLVLPSDLPFVQTLDIVELLHQRTDNDLVINGDRQQTGTNALFLPLLVPFQFLYGVDSFLAHIDEAKRHNLRCIIFDNKQIQFDLDNEEDWRQYQRSTADKLQLTEL